MNDATVIDVMLSLARNCTDLDYGVQLGMEDDTMFRRNMLYKEVFERIMWCGAEAPELQVRDVRDVLTQLIVDVTNAGEQAWDEDNGA